MLYNTNLYNQRLYNGGTALAEVFSTDILVFEGFSLSDGTTMVLSDFPTAGPTRDLIGGSIPRGDGMYREAEYFRETTFEAGGWVKKSTAATLDAYLDTIKKNLRVPEGDLDVTDANGTVKRFIATVDNFDEMFSDRKYYHRTLCPWKVRFRCKTPFGKARSYTAVSEAVTTSPTNLSVYNAGTWEAQPIITLNFDAASSVTAASVLNNTTGETISYSGSIAANDTLVFNSELKSVTKNGTAVDFSGAFPTLDVGGNLLTFTVTASSFSAYTTVSHRTTYL